jgi:hypothetical protein
MVQVLLSCHLAQSPLFPFPCSLSLNKTLLLLWKKKKKEKKIEKERKKEKEICFPSLFLQVFFLFFLLGISNFQVLY